jgi:hypothetical protein
VKGMCEIYESVIFLKIFTSCNCKLISIRDVRLLSALFIFALGILCAI